MFKDAVDKFDPILKENSVYTFSNGTIKLANLKFSSIKNDFSIVLDPHAKIVEVMDDETIQSQAYCF
jgi:replication factor A1